MTDQLPQPTIGQHGRDLVIGVTPFEEPNAELAVAVQRAGGLGVLDLGRDARQAREALADAVRWARTPIGVRVPAGCPLPPEALPPAGAVDTVVLPPGSPFTVEAARHLGVGDASAGEGGRRVLVEVTSLNEALAAAQAGADGLIAKGCEAGGRVGELTAFVLLQQLARRREEDPALALPLWLAGGIGLHSAAAAIAGGAAGVVLDAQLALVREAALPSPVAAAIAAMDGSETAVVAGHRIYVRPDLPAARLADAEPVAGDQGDQAATAAAVARRLGARDLRGQLLPVGQDGAFARPLADRYRTAGGVVAAVRVAIGEHLEAAVAVEPLAPGSAFARSRPAGLRYPVAQGPMTRVSDRAAFAAAVAGAGGLPFLALALLRGEEVRALLEETAALLGERPWGVGILGFVPAELREAQLQAVLELRPPCALIAGGRPSQATELEAAGIDTFLHVPSPGLLDQFLAQGARKFVFEGRECGGHVGPRASFPLWDSQVERLLHAAASGQVDPAELQVLFAGGIHDERSAAMVAALAAPLAARGAGIGVLLGTAYLFTEEAVATGAIVPGFQRQALACQRTVLLETAPGHATRCADSAYAATFHDTRRRLRQAGRSNQEVWQELERLNLGRLRIASKGLRRDGSDLVAVAEAEQRQEGLYMLGQVAALRSETTTIAALHRQVTEGATELLASRAADVRRRPGSPEGRGHDDRDNPAAGFRVPVRGAPPTAAYQLHEGARLGYPQGQGRSAGRTGGDPQPLDVAIVGMACVLPEATDLARYWANVVGGVDAVTKVPADRWDPAIYYDPGASGQGAGRRTPSKWGGFLPDVPFDALAYGIPPASLAAIEPVQLLALEVAARALHDAGYSSRPFDRARTSVIFGAEAGTDLGNAYGFRSLWPSYAGPLPPELEEHLPALTEDSFPGLLANVIAGRIANRLDLGGVNYTVDAACASSLAALDLACKELRSGSSDLVLCGAADTHNSIHDYLLFASVHALSPSGRCRTFDAAADGIALGEGVACLALKRLEDAERDGDRVYAVIKAVAGSSDGRSLGLTAPRPDGQRSALERAYRLAGVSPAQVGLIEAHGAGTVVGDRAELATLTALFTEAGASPGSCALGSVKSQIGHTKCAAGLAGVIKAARALHAGVRPPTCQLETPNRFWQHATSPFCFDRSARPWAAPPARRVAGVSAFGFGGTNFHAVLAAYDGAPEPAHGLDEWPAELFLFRGADRQEAAAQLDRLADLLNANDRAGRPWQLRHLARTVTLAGEADGPARRPVRLALVAGDLDDLAAKLAKARAFTSDAAAGIFAAPQDGGPGPGKVAFLFPGQGSQRPGMLADLFVAFPRLHRYLRLGERWADVIFPPAAFTPEERAAQEAALTDTRNAQPALGIAGLAMHALLGTLGVRPDLAGGHSYGELVALCAAGALDEAELLELSAARAAAILGAVPAGDPGAMAAVAAPPATVQAALPEGAAGDVVVANHNAPAQTVISGPHKAVEAALDELARRGIPARRLPVACAFHSPLVAGAAAALAAALERLAVPLRAPSIPVWSNLTAAPYPADPEQLRATLARQVAEPVRFAEQVEAMYAAGARVFVEAGPGRVLTQLVGAILGDRPHLAVACDAGAGEHGLRHLLAALAQLAAAGIPVEPAALFEGRDAATVDVAAVPRRPGWIVNGHLTRTADGQCLPGGLRPARTLARPPLLQPAAATASAPAAGTLTGRDALVAEFLRGVRELIASQRDVLLGYLGAAAAPAAIPAPAPAPAWAPAATAAEPRQDRAGSGGLPDTAVGEAAGPAPSGQGGQPPLTPAAILQAALAVVSERTGYPLDMLDPDLDLEADLSIDSIKRTEILGDLAERIGLPVSAGRLDEPLIEELARCKTLRAIVDRIAAHPTTSQPPPSAPAARPRRYLVRAEPLAALVPADPEGRARLAARRFVIVEDGQGVGLELSDLLERHGAEARLVAAAAANASGDALAGANGIVHLAALDPAQRPVLPGAYAALRAALLGGARSLLLATGAGGAFGHDWDGDPATDPAPGAGLRGLARTIAIEFPEVAVCCVDLDPKDQPARLAAHLLAELLAADRGGAAAPPPVVVGWRNGTRATLQVVEAELRPPLTDGSAGGELAAAAQALGLGPDAVVLLAGGARGITAKVAAGLAKASGCHVELLGRTPAPTGPEDPATAQAADRAALRRALTGQGVRVPAEVEAAASRLLAQREIRATLATLRQTAASVHYHQVDVRDAVALRRLVDDLYARHGRLDGVVYGAGVLDDRLLRDKTPDAFERVYRTKVDGAAALAGALRPDLGFLALFASVSGVFGNRGQADYAAANDALDTLARVWARRFHGRVIAVDWGPWAAGAPGTGAGMVSAELEREYARRGIGTIDPDQGVACLLRELAWGDASQVLYLCAAPEAFTPPAGRPR